MLSAGAVALKINLCLLVFRFPCNLVRAPHSQHRLVPLTMVGYAQFTQLTSYSILYW